LIDALARLGGTFSSLVGVGAIISSMYAYKLFQSSLIGKLFHFTPRFPEEIPKKKKKKKKDKGKSSEDESGAYSNFHDDSNYVYKEDPLVKKEKKVLKELIKYRKAKWKFKTSAIIKNLLQCRNVCPRKIKRYSKSLRQDLYFQIAMEHLEKDMDISKIMLKIR